MFNSENLDDPIVSDEQAGFRGGQASFLPARKLRPDQYSVGINCDLTLLGDIVTRRGSSRLGTGAVTPPFPVVKGLTFYDTPSQQILIAGVTGGPYYFNGTTWVLLSLGVPVGSGAVGRVRYAQGINTLYMADGAQNIWSWDGAAAADLGNAANDEPPAAPRYIVWHTNRLVAAGMDNERDAVYFSQFLDGATWDKSLWQIRVGAGEGDAITGLVAWTNFNLVVLKQRSIWIVNCDPTADVADFQIKCVHRRIGCPQGDTAVQVGSDVFFLSDSGVRSLRHTLATEDQSEVGEALSAPIQDLILRINPLAVASATYWNNRYILAVTIDTSTRVCIPYSTLTDSWLGTWTGMNISNFAFRKPAGEVERLVYSTGTGEVKDWLDYQRHDQEVEASYQDQGADIPTYMRARAMDFGERQSPKTGLNVEVELFDSSATTVTLSRRLNGATVDSSMTSFAATSNAYGASATDLRESADLQSVGPFRELQLSLSTTAGKLGVRSLTANAFVDTMELQTV